MKSRAIFVFAFCLVSIARLNAQGSSGVILGGGDGDLQPPPSGGLFAYTLTFNQPLQYTVTQAYTGEIFFDFAHEAGPDTDRITNINLAYSIDGGSPQSINGVIDPSPDGNTIALTINDLLFYYGGSETLPIGSVVTLGPGNVTGEIGSNTYTSQFPADNSTHPSYIINASGFPISNAGVVVPEPATYAVLFGPAALVAAVYFKKRKKTNSPS